MMNAIHIDQLRSDLIRGEYKTQMSWVGWRLCWGKPLHLVTKPSPFLPVMKEDSA